MNSGWHSLSAMLIVRLRSFQEQLDTFQRGCITSSDRNAVAPVLLDREIRMIQKVAEHVRVMGRSSQQVEFINDVELGKRKLCELGRLKLCL